MKPTQRPILQTEIMAGILLRIKKLPEKNSVCSESSHPYLIIVIVGVIYDAIIIFFSEAFLLKLAQKCVSESFTRQSLVLLPRVPTIKKQQLSDTRSYERQWSHSKTCCYFMGNEQVYMASAPTELCKKHSRIQQSHSQCSTYKSPSLSLIKYFG